MEPRELPPLIGEDDAFLEAVEQASAAAHVDRPVLVIGERGTGKELIAARIHYLSPRWAESYQALNCAALAEDLLETELFGHTAGAFTGASKARIGRFEQASGGTLFLDELASTSPRLQEKLLRVIEYGEYERVGSSQTLRVDVRLVAAANVDLPSAAAAGRFRADLLDRLSFEVVTLPPLRARPGDITRLARHFAESMSRELGRSHFAGFGRLALQQLADYPWPGNVRELRNVVERAVYRHTDPDERVQRLVIDPFASPWRPPASLADAAAMTPQNENTPRPVTAPPPTPSATGRSSGETAALPTDFHAHIRGIEKAVLERALDAHAHHQKRTAAALGLSYDQLRHLLKTHDLLKRRTAPGA
ncbi:MAG: phage shock protein operon transcriptional activator [Oceanococcaceae bacterium]